MKAVRPRFSVAAYFYLVAFFVLLAALPLVVMAASDRGTELTDRWIVSTVWVGVIAGLWFYANRWCSSDRMRLSDGLLFVTSSMMMGWVYISFVLVFPALLLAFTGSVFVAVSGNIRRAPGYSQTQWLRLVRFFYRNRMVQQ